MPKNEVSYKASLPAHQALIHLENLVDSLKKGSVYLQVGQAQVILNLDEVLTMDVAVGASEKKGKNRISWELSWKKVRPDSQETASILISSQAPGAAEPATAKPAAKAAKAPAKTAAKKTTQAKKPAAKKKSPRKAPTKKAAKTAKSKRG